MKLIRQCPDCGRTILLVLLTFLLNLGSAVAAETTVKYEYSPSGRLTKVIYSTGITISYEYDPAGNLLKREIGLGLTGLYFPFLQGDAGTMVGIAVSNYSDNPAELQFTAFGQSGTPLPLPTNPASVILDSGKQYARLDSEIFGGDPKVPRAGWVEVKTDNSEIGSFFQFLDTSLRQLDGSVALTRQSERLHFSRVFEGERSFFGQAASTFLSIANPNDTPVTLDLTLYRAVSEKTRGLQAAPRAEVISQETVNIAPKGFLYQSISQLFGESDVSSGYVLGEVTDGEGAVGFELISLLGHSTVVGLNASYGNSGTESFSAQLAEVSLAISTSLKLVNTSDQTRQLTLTAVGEDGSNLAEPVVMALEPGAMLEQDMAAIFSFPAQESGGTPLNTPQTSIVGSFRMQSDGSGVIGDVIFYDPVQFRFAASMPLQTERFTKAVFSQVANAVATLGFFTGLAFYNPSSQTASINIKVIGSDGVLAGEHTEELAPGRRFSKLVDEKGLIPESAGLMGGYIVISSTVPVIAQQLFGLRNLNLMSAVPPSKVQ